MGSALLEIHRITKPGGTIYIGEIPEKNEMAGMDYKAQIGSWLFWVLKNQGFKLFLWQMKNLTKAFFSREPFVVSATNMFYLPPDEFLELLRECGLCVVEHFRHKEIDENGKIYESVNRWDYVAKKQVNHMVY